MCVCAPLVLDILLTRLLAALLVVVFARLRVSSPQMRGGAPRIKGGGGGPTGAEPAAVVEAGAG